MRHKNKLNETNFMRRMMGLGPINERYDISPEDQEEMQLVSNVMTPEGYSQPGGIVTQPFEYSDEGREWKRIGGKRLSPDRLEYATNKTIEDANVGSWKAKKYQHGIIIHDDYKDLLIVEAIKGGDPNWQYVIRPASGFDDYEEDLSGIFSVQGEAEVLKNYKEYSKFLNNVLHSYAPTVKGDDTEPELDESWCKRFLDIDWYFDKLKIGKGYLKKYDCGEAVEVAQDHMNEYEGSEVIEVDSAYGDKTIKEVKKVQDELDLKVDGYYGQKTHDALIRAIGGGKGAPNQPEDEIEKMPIKGPEEIDVDIDVDKEVIAPDDSGDFDFDKEVKGVGTDVDVEDVEADFEKKAKDKALKRKKRRGKRKLEKLDKKRTKYKKRYDIGEQKTFKIKKDGKVITLTESDVKKIINLKK